MQQIRWCITHDCQVIQDQETRRAWCVMGDDQNDDANCLVRAATVDDGTVVTTKNRWVF